MKTNEFVGYWLLKSRVDYPEQDNLLIIGDRSYTINNPTLEVFVFSINNNKYCHLGIDLISEDEVGIGREYYISSFFQRTFHFTDDTFITIDSETMKIINGNINVNVRQTDYLCDEIWERSSNNQEDLIKLIDSKIGHLD